MKKLLLLSVLLPFLATAERYEVESIKPSSNEILITVIRHQLAGDEKITVLDDDGIATLAFLQNMILQDFDKRVKAGEKIDMGAPIPNSEELKPIYRKAFDLAEKEMIKGACMQDSTHPQAAAECISTLKLVKNLKTAVGPQINYTVINELGELLTRVFKTHIYKVTNLKTKKVKEEAHLLEEFENLFRQRFPNFRLTNNQNSKPDFFTKKDFEVEYLPGAFFLAGNLKQIATAWKKPEIGITKVAINPLGFVETAEEDHK